MDGAFFHFIPCIIYTFQLLLFQKSILSRSVQIFDIGVVSRNEWMMDDHPHPSLRKIEYSTVSNAHCPYVQSTTSTIRPQSRTLWPWSSQSKCFVSLMTHRSLLSITSIQRHLISISDMTRHDQSNRLSCSIITRNMIATASQSSPWCVVLMIS